MRTSILARAVAGVAAFVGLSVLPTVAGAQSAQRRAGTLTASAGLGVGSTSFSCDVCESRRDNGIAGLVRVGVGISSALTVGVEASGWTDEQEDSRGTSTTRAAFAQVVAQWYPARAGAFLKLGGGIAWLRDEIDIRGLGQTEVTVTSPALVVGAGWDIPIARHWALTPYADFNYAADRDQTINDLARAEPLGARVLHFGVAVSVR